LKFYFIRDEIKKGEIDVRYIETKLMMADILTKGIMLWTLKEINVIDLKEIVYNDDICRGRV